ncbi:hypothetical protein V490_06151 [Pseudogymnoascus sp. VKM F-3557]|nr:hypothetical protein V490_06151 [Pseudogymnoascus sp. VKM F-3557]
MSVKSDIDGEAAVKSRLVYLAIKEYMGGEAGAEDFLADPTDENYMKFRTKAEQLVTMLETGLQCVLTYGNTKCND